MSRGAGGDSSRGESPEAPSRDAAKPTASPDVAHMSWDPSGRRLAVAFADAPAGTRMFPAGAVGLFSTRLAPVIRASLVGYVTAGATFANHGSDEGGGNALDAAPPGPRARLCSRGRAAPRGAARRGTRRTPPRRSPRAGRGGAFPSCRCSCDATARTRRRLFVCREIRYVLLSLSTRTSFLRRVTIVSYGRLRYALYEDHALHALHVSIPRDANERLRRGGRATQRALRLLRAPARDARPAEDVPAWRRRGRVVRG